MPGHGEERGGAAGGSATPWSALELLSQQQDRDDAGAEQPKGAATAAAAAAQAPSKPLDVGAPRSSQHHTQEAVHAPAPSTSLSMSPLTKIEEKNLSKVHASPALMGQTSADSEPRRVSDVDSESAIDGESSVIHGARFRIDPDASCRHSLDTVHGPAEDAESLLYWWHL